MQIGDWRWLDFGNVPGVLDWVAFILGTIGMGVALVQLFKSRGALAAAKKALDDARRGLVRDQLLQVLPRFTEISASLDDAIRADSRELAQKALGRFSEHAAEAAALLEEQRSSHAPVLDKLRRASAAAANARSRLFEVEGETTGQRVGVAADHVRDIGTTLIGVSVKVGNEVGKQDV